MAIQTPHNDIHFVVLVAETISRVILIWTDRLDMLEAHEISVNLASRFAGENSHLMFVVSSCVKYMVNYMSATTQASSTSDFMVESEQVTDFVAGELIHFSSFQN